MNHKGETMGDIDKAMMFHLVRALTEHGVRKGDLVVLATGDGDLAFVVEYLCNQDIEVLVLAFEDHAAPPMKFLPTEFIALDQLEGVLYRKTRIIG